MKSQVRLDKLWFLYVFAQCCTHAHGFGAHSANKSEQDVLVQRNISRSKCVALIEGGKIQVFFSPRE